MDERLGYFIFFKSISFLFLCLKKLFGHVSVLDGDVPNELDYVWFISSAGHHKFSFKSAPV